MDEHFTFTPDSRESLQALRVVSRSIGLQTVSPRRQLLTCLAIYGLPLLIAGVLFRDAFGEIYFTWFVFVAALWGIPRLNRSALTTVANVYSIETDVFVTADRIRRVSVNAEIVWPWSSVARLHLLESQVLLEFRDWEWITLPNRLWPDDEAKARFLDQVRTRAPDVVFSTAGRIATPFTLINVAAAFGAADLFLASLIVLTVLAHIGCRCGGSWQIAGQPVSFATLYLCVLGISAIAFFPIRISLRALQRKSATAAVVLANLLIWIGPLAVVATAIVR